MEEVPQKTLIKIGDDEIEVTHHSNKYYHYNISEIIEKYLKIVPREDIKGLGHINIYDKCPSGVPIDKAGGYYLQETLNKPATIDIYLSNSLGHMPSPSEISLIKKLKNWLHVKLFGKYFVADTLFHEIGHHKYYKNSSGEGDSEKNIENHAENYATELLWKAHPFLYRNYGVWNKLYRYIYKERIKQSEGT